MLRPPVREICLDLFEDFYHNRKLALITPFNHILSILIYELVDKELSNMSIKFLKKWRPIALEAPAPRPAIEGPPSIATAAATTVDVTNAQNQEQATEKQVVQQQNTQAQPQQQQLVEGVSS